MDIRSLDLNLLPVFDALLRHRSVSLAARELDMSQPAMSHALKRLRTLLGDPLFVRTGRGVMPTARADSLGLPVRDILERVRDGLMTGGRFEPAESQRAFNVCLSDVGSFVLWPGIVQAVLEKAPQARLRLRSLEPARIGAALESGDIDLAVGAYPQLPDSLFQQRLFERKYVCLMRAGHALAGRKPGLRQFAAALHVRVTAPSGMQETVDAALAARGLQRTVALELPSYLMLPPLLETGDYVSIVPGQLADAFAGRGRLATAPVPLPLPAVVIRQHWHRRVHEDGANVWLRGVVAGLFGESRFH